jgi:glycosyltransferase involved in cell wall biosynthesis
MTKISFIFPTFKEEKFIGETLDQFKPCRGKYDFELVVADGGSPDKTQAVAKEHGADKIAVKKPGQSNHISVGRNNGGWAADGEMLVWLDADMRAENIDLLFKRILDVYNDPKVVAATANIWVYKNEETFFDKVFHGLVNLIIRSAYWRGGAAAKGECQILRGSTWRELKGYDENLVVSEDIDMFRRMLTKGKVIFLKDVNLFESPRRYRQLGHLKVVFDWLANYLGFVLFRKSYSKEWKAFR